MEWLEPGLSWLLCLEEPMGRRWVGEQPQGLSPHSGCSLSPYLECLSPTLSGEPQATLPVPQGLIRCLLPLQFSLAQPHGQQSS